MSATKKVPTVIGIGTLFAAFYQLAPQIGVPIEIIVGLFLLSPFVVIYMAYVILKYGTPSEHTFDMKFYDDR